MHNRLKHSPHICNIMCFLFSEDLSKSEDKEDTKKEGEDGKAAKKADDPEVNSALNFCFHFSYCTVWRYISFYFVHLLPRLLKSQMSLKNPPFWTRKRKQTLLQRRRTERRRQMELKGKRKKLKTWAKRKRRSLWRRTLLPTSRVKVQRARLI